MIALLGFLQHIFGATLAFWRQAITPVKTDIRPTDAEVVGAMPTQGGIVGLITNIKNNASPAFGNKVLTSVAVAAAARTYTGAEMVGGLIKRYGSGPITDSTDTATNIVAAIPGAVVGQTFPMFLMNLGSVSALTMAAGTGVTLTGSAVVNGLSTRLFLGTVTGSTAVTITNMFQFSTPNG